MSLLARRRHDLGRELARGSPSHRPARKNGEQGNMNPDEIRERFLDFRRRLYVDHDLSAVDDHLHAEFRSASPLIREAGIPAYKQFVQGFYRGVPDLRPVEQFVLVEVSHLMAMTSWKATHTGPFLGCEPTGKELMFSTADKYELRDRKLFRHWDVVDRLNASIAMGLLQDAR